MPTRGRSSHLTRLLLGWGGGVVGQPPFISAAEGDAKEHKM